MRLLVTRPRADAERTAAALHGRGHTAIVAPLLRIEPFEAPSGTGPWAAILVTSANAALAAQGALPALRDVPVFAVGERSAQAMRAAGFAAVTSADGSVDALARLVAARVKPGAPVLYLAGEQRAGDLAGELGRSGHDVRTVVAYRAVAATTVPEPAADALRGGIDGVLHFSRRSAECYVNAARASGLSAEALAPTHFCLSAEVAAPLLAAGAARVRVAPQPTEAALIGLVCESG